MQSIIFSTLVKTSPDNNIAGYNFFVLVSTLKQARRIAMEWFLSLRSTSSEGDCAT
jgi:hypothetical protein